MSDVPVAAQPAAPVLVEPVAPPVVPAIEPIPAAAPVSGTPAVEPPVIASPAEVPASVPEPAAPAAEAKPTSETPTLLEAAATPPPPAAAPKPEDAAAVAEPVEPATPEPIEYDFKFPEGVNLDQEQLGKFTELANAARLEPEMAQQLVDMHVTATQQIMEHAAAEQHRIWGETRAGWRQEVMADEEMGGAGHQTAMAAVARMRDLLVPEGQRQAFADFLRVTGAGDHPAFLRALYNAAKMFDEPAPAPVGKPPPGLGRRPPGLRSRPADWYDHPRSNGAA